MDHVKFELNRKDLQGLIEYYRAEARKCEASGDKINAGRFFERSNRFGDLIHSLSSDDQPEQRTCGTCVEIMGDRCGNPMVYLDHGENVHRTTPETKACGFYYADKQTVKQCKHCNARIIKRSSGLWNDDKKELSQYCWVDPVGGSQLHEPK